MKVFKYWLRRLGLFALIGLLYYGLASIFACPIRYLTGVSCPGCGMTRAWEAVCQLNIRKAFSYHPLFWLGPFLVLAIFLEERVKISKKIWFGLVAAFIGAYLTRIIFFPDSIVYFRPEEGLIGRIFLKLRG